MRQSRHWLLALVVGLLGLTGCASPRFVQVGEEGGIVALPSNTNIWPSYHRDKAEAMIRQQCPNGYEIVSEEEAVTGQVAHTDSRTDTKENPTLLLAGGNGKTEKNKRGESSSTSFGGLAIPLGEREETTRTTTRYQNVTEWRIHYRKKQPAPGVVPAAVR
jgi:hypothetical protein